MDCRCSECHNKVSLIGLHQEEIDAIGPDYVCSVCMDEADLEDMIDNREHVSHYVRNGSCL